MYIEPWVFWGGVIVLVLWIIGVNKWTADCAKDINKIFNCLNDLNDRCNRNADDISELMADQTVEDILDNKKK